MLAMSVSRGVVSLLASVPETSADAGVHVHVCVAGLFLVYDCGSLRVLMRAFYMGIPPVLIVSGPGLSCFVPMVDC